LPLRHLKPLSSVGLRGTRDGSASGSQDHTHGRNGALTHAGFPRACEHWKVKIARHASNAGDGWPRRAPSLPPLQTRTRIGTHDAAEG